MRILAQVDRNAIERHDFPVGRRGYDPAAVDAHLRAVADEIESLRGRPVRPEPHPLSAGTSEQVRLILEAAERSAAELHEQAGREAGEHVARVEEATSLMLARLDMLQGELDGLLAGLRRSGEALEAGLARLREDVSAAGTPAPPEPEAVPEPPVVEALDEPADPAAIAQAAGADEPETGVADEPDSPRPNGGADEAGARLIALNMALSGTPREETARYLAAHYALADADALLDDVYKRAGA
jgi:DivIVA domain-containing protein